MAEKKESKAMKRTIIQLSHKTFDVVKAAAIKEDVSISEIIRRAVNKYFNIEEK